MIAIQLNEEPLVVGIPESELRAGDTVVQLGVNTRPFRVVAYNPDTAALYLAPLWEERSHFELVHAVNKRLWRRVNLGITVTLR